MADLLKGVTLLTEDQYVELKRNKTITVDNTTYVFSENEIYATPTTIKTTILGTTAPTTSTVGELGQLYFDMNNSNVYVCKEITTDEETSISTYSWSNITSSGVSQEDFDKLVNNETQIAYSKGGFIAGSTDTIGSGSNIVVIGSGTTFSNSSNAVVIGHNAKSYGGANNISIGNGAITSVANAIQLGTGTNDTWYTLQIYNDNIYNHNTHTLTTQNIELVNASSEETVSNTIKFGEFQLFTSPTGVEFTIEHSPDTTNILNANGGSVSLGNNTASLMLYGVDDRPTYIHGAESTNDSLALYSEVVTLNTAQTITGLKTFNENIYLANSDGTIDRISHINNNFIIYSGAENGIALLNIDEGLEKIYAFNKELAFKEDIASAAGTTVYVAGTAQTSISVGADIQTQIDAVASSIDDKADKSVVDQNTVDINSLETLVGTNISDISALETSVNNLTTTVAGKANTSALANYLPLTGGTLTGDVILSGSTIKVPSYLSGGGGAWMYVNYTGNSYAPLFSMAISTDSSLRCVEIGSEYFTNVGVALKSNKLRPYYNIDWSTATSQVSHEHQLALLSDIDDALDTWHYFEDVTEGVLFYDVASSTQSSPTTIYLADIIPEYSGSGTYELLCAMRMYESDSKSLWVMSDIMPYYGYSPVHSSNYARFSGSFVTVPAKSYIQAFGESGIESGYIWIYAYRRVK